MKNIVLKIYRPISVLPICGKTFEKLVFNEMFKFLIEIELTSPNQSEFKRSGEKQCYVK